MPALDFPDGMSNM